MKKKKDNRLLIFASALAILMIVGAYVYSRYSIPAPTAGSTTSVDTIAVSPDVNISDAPPEAMTQQNPESSKNTMCQSMKASYTSVDEVKKKEKIDLRFVNVHKRVDGITYRLRFFYKDSTENEIPTYLVYKENQSDEDILTEKSPYKKGKLYAKIEKAQGDILYTEEGMNIGRDQDLFLHYENKVLKDLQGISPLPNEKDFIECRFF